MTSHLGAEEAIDRPTRERSGLAWLLPTTALLISLTLGLVLWQYSNDSELAAGATAERGLVVYREAGCGACHGQDGLGGTAPAMGGHSAEQIVRQVRAPFKPMPMYTRRELSDADLAAIVAFSNELEPVDHAVRWETTEGGIDPRDVLAVHHWLALTALRDDDVFETSHQIFHISEHVGGQHLEAMRVISVLINSGATDDAEAQLAEMTAGYVPEADVIDRVNLGLAARALTAGDSAEASLHLEVAEGGAFSAVADRARQAIEAGNPHDGVDILIEALSAGP